MGANLILLILLSAFKTQEFSFIWVKFLVLSSGSTTCWRWIGPLLIWAIAGVFSFKSNEISSLVSSTQLLVMHFIGTEMRSFVCILKRRGANILPWGIPLTLGRASESENLLPATQIATKPFCTWRRSSCILKFRDHQFVVDAIEGLTHVK